MDMEFCHVSHRNPWKCIGIAQLPKNLKFDYLPAAGRHIPKISHITGEVCCPFFEVS